MDINTPHGRQESQSGQRWTASRYRCRWRQEQGLVPTDGDIYRSIAAATAAAAHSSRIAYATRPLGVRCRPRASTPTQCPKACGVELHTTVERRHHAAEDASPPETNAPLLPQTKLGWMRWSIVDEEAVGGGGGGRGLESSPYCLYIRSEARRGSEASASASPSVPCACTCTCTCCCCCTSHCKLWRNWWAVPADAACALAAEDTMCCACC